VLPETTPRIFETRPTPISMLKAVIFDLDGVLVDSHPSHIRVWKKLLAIVDKQMSEADLWLLRDGRKKEDMLRHFLGALTDDEVRTYSVLKDAFSREEIHTITTTPGVRELLAELFREGLPIAVASCGGRARVHQTLEALRLKHYVTNVATGDDVTAGKPDPEIFLNVANQMKVRPAEAVVFEDAVSGVQAATAAGMRCIGIADRLHASALLAAGAIHVLQDFAHLSLASITNLLSAKLVDHYDGTLADFASLDHPPITGVEGR
jgi:HAD superfamily hydrolase (TIGR01509 family)